MEASMNLLLKEGHIEFCNSFDILLKCTTSQYLNMGDNLLSCLPVAAMWKLELLCMISNDTFMNDRDSSFS